MDTALRATSGRAGKLAGMLTMLGLSLGYFMVLLDMTVVSVALPAIRDDLGGGIAGLQWVVNAYTIVFAGLLLSMGAFADRMGARRVYLGGLALFLAASALSAVAPSLGALIALRALLGIGGAALMPASLALIAHAYPAPAERARALGAWAATTGAAMAAGPVVGGLLVDAFGWRGIFWLNVPIAVVSLAMTARFVGETERKPGRSFDWGGQLSAIVAIAALSFGLMEGERYGWRSPAIVAAFGFALLSAIAFARTQAKGRSPLLPLRLFKNATVSAGMLAGMAVNVGLSGILFVVPLSLQQAGGLSARMAGLALLPMMVPLAFNPILTGRIVARIGARVPMTAGFALAGAGTLFLVLTEAKAGNALTVAGLLLVGIGVSFVLPSLMAAVMAAVPKEQAGAISGALNSGRQLGATLGVAVLGAIVEGGDTMAAGVRLSLLLAAVILLGGSLLSFTFIGRK